LPERALRLRILACSRIALDELGIRIVGAG
jgi:hypothetical protein